MRIVLFYIFQWAGRISKKYQNALRKRGDRRPPGWNPPTDGEMVSRTVKIERCGCERQIKGHRTMMVYDGAEDGVNSSISTCSRHSYLRGAKQRVKFTKIQINSYRIVIDFLIM